MRPAYSADLLVDTREADSVVARVHSLPEGGDGAQGAASTALQLTEGRWPQAPANVWSKRARGIWPGGWRSAM